jgi:hypothetical protein
LGAREPFPSQPPAENGYLGFKGKNMAAARDYGSHGVHGGPPTQCLVLRVANPFAHMMANLFQKPMVRPGRAGHRRPTREAAGCRRGAG